MADKTTNMRCERCKTFLEASGQEPMRFICPKCGQNYFAVMHLVPVEPLRPKELGQGDEAPDAGKCGTSE